MQDQIFVLTDSVSVGASTIDGSAIGIPSVHGSTIALTPPPPSLSSPSSIDHSIRSSAKSMKRRRRISSMTYPYPTIDNEIHDVTKEKMYKVKQEQITLLDDVIIQAKVKDEFYKIKEEWAARGRNENDPDVLSRIKNLMILIGNQARTIPPVEYKMLPSVPHLRTFLVLKYADNMKSTPWDTKVYYGGKLNDAYAGLNFCEFDRLGCVTCTDSVVNSLCTNCWTASRCMSCVKRLGCKNCLKWGQVSKIAFKLPSSPQASHLKPPQKINNKHILDGFLNFIPDNTTWMESIGSGQILLDEGVSGFLDLLSRGFNKGGQAAKLVAEFKNMCSSNGWIAEEMSVNSHDNLCRAHYLAKCIPRFRSNWGTKSLICPYCSDKFVTCVREVAGKYVADRCKVCAEKDGNVSGLHFQGRSYFCSVKIKSKV